MVSCMEFGREVAKELGIPEVQFWAASACGFMAYLQYGELVKRGIVPFKGFVSGGRTKFPGWGLSSASGRTVKDGDVSPHRHASKSFEGFLLFFLLVLLTGRLVFGSECLDSIGVCCLSGLGREVPSRLLSPGVKREAPNFTASRTGKLGERSGGDRCVFLVSWRPDSGEGRIVTMSNSEDIWERGCELLPVLDRRWVVSRLARSRLVRRSILMKGDGGGDWLSRFSRVVVGFSGGGLGSGWRRLLLGGSEWSEVPSVTVNGKWTPVAAWLDSQLFSAGKGSDGVGLGPFVGPAKAFVRSVSSSGKGKTKKNEGKKVKPGPVASTVGLPASSEVAMDPVKGCELLGTAATDLGSSHVEVSASKPAVGVGDPPSDDMA